MSDAPFGEQQSQRRSFKEWTADVDAFIEAGKKEAIEKSNTRPRSSVEYLGQLVIDLSFLQGGL